MWKIQRGYDSVTRTFRLPEELVSELETLATQNKLSLNQLVIQCLRYSVEHLDKSDSWQAAFPAKFWKQAKEDCVSSLIKATFINKLYLLSAFGSQPIFNQKVYIFRRELLREENYINTEGFLIWKAPLPSIVSFLFLPRRGSVFLITKWALFVRREARFCPSPQRRIFPVSAFYARLSLCRPSTLVLRRWFPRCRFCRCQRILSRRLEAALWGSCATTFPCRSAIWR